MAPFPVEHDRIHCANGILLLNSTFEPVKFFCVNQLVISYNPVAASPQRWPTFLSELLEADDIPTLQEYIGYCLIPSTQAQKMMLIIVKGGEGKSRIELVLNAMLRNAMDMDSIQKVETNQFARTNLKHRLLMVDDGMDMNALPRRITSSPWLPPRPKWTWSARASRATSSSYTLGSCASAMVH